MILVLFTSTPFDLIVSIAFLIGFGITLSQFFAESDMVELSPDTRELFESWVVLIPEQKTAALQMIKAMSKDK